MSLRFSEEEFQAFMARRGKGSKSSAGQLVMPSKVKAVPKTSYAGRGLEFEKLIGISNEAYFRAGIAYVFKVPTSSRIINRDGKPIQIQLPSPVDYAGSWQGRALALEAKETHEARWPLSKILEHQIQFLLDWQRGGGIAGILIRFAVQDKVFWLPIGELMNFTERKVRGGRKSIALVELGDRWAVKGTRRAALDYLETIERWMT
jgi:recombination protein U